MNGAETVLRTLVASGVDLCFANPGTSEMQFVAALDEVHGMRGVLGLFEGVVTGAADGYGRMAGRPAAALLHLGPGLGNGLANLHNARRANTPVVVVVGDHAVDHVRFDPPLASDIEAVAGTVSAWVRRARTVTGLGQDTAAAVAAAMHAPGQVATLIVPADLGWSDGGQVGRPVPATTAPVVGEVTVTAIAKVLRSGEPCTLLLGGGGTRRRALLAAQRIAAATGARLLCETFPARLERGGALPAVERLGYFAEQAGAQLSGVRHLVLAGARSPVAFFAYPGRPSSLVPPDCEQHVLATDHEDVTEAMEHLADLLWTETALPPSGSRVCAPTGALDAESMAAAVGATLPDGAIVVDEANTSGLFLPAATAAAPEHDWLTLTGGAIGQGLPAATGAALACPDRPVLCLESDGSAMYTISALWTQAREGLDVTTVILDNSSYAILNIELARTGTTTPGPQARRMLSLAPPHLDFLSLAVGMGVPASRAMTADELVAELRIAQAEPGPHLIHAVL
ncbi:MAG TPA: acetolactate synthase large subunit [Kutzneria sp.]|nr:acetolactate synthase large subunit [Kutzneria sp.]